AGVERFDRHLVALADLADHARPRQLHAVEDQLAGGGGSNPELVLPLADRKALAATLHRERRDALVPPREVGVGEDDEQPGLGAVRDPQLAPLEDPALAAPGRLGLEPEGIRSRLGLGEGVGAGPTAAAFSMAATRGRTSCSAKSRTVSRNSSSSSESFVSGGIDAISGIAPAI